MPAPAAFAAYVLITAFTPGPNNIMSMSNASRLGFRRSFPFNLGILAGFLVVMALCTAFSSLLYAFIPRIRMGMQVLGAAYMLYLAYKTFTSKPGSDTGSPSRSGFISGALLQFINPKIYIYAITSMSAYVLPYYTDTLPIAAFAVLLAVVGFISTLCWALFGSAFGRLFARHGRVINTIMALLLVYCAVSLFF